MRKAMMNLDVQDVLNELRALGAMPVLENDKLQIKPAEIKLDGVLIKQLKANETAIIEFLGSFENTKTVEQMEVVPHSGNRMPLSYTQERIWYMDRFDGSESCHIPVLWKLTGALSVETLQKAFSSVINRHEILRTVYRDLNGTPYQEVLEEKDWELDVLNFSRASYPEIRAFISREVNRSFKLDQGPPVRAVLIKAGDNCYYFSVVIHHIAFDGWSIPVFYRDLVQNYEAFQTNNKPKLPPLNLQYLDHTVWHRKTWDHTTNNDQLDYWNKKLSGHEPLKLKTEFQGELEKGIGNTMIDHMIPREVSDKVEELSKENESTMYLYLMAAFKILLYKYTGQRDLIVGRPVANRQNENIGSLIGCFTNTVPLRSIIDPTNSFRAFLKEINETSSSALQNQDAPMEKIIEGLGNLQDLSKRTLIQSVLVLQHEQEQHVKKMSDVELEWEPSIISDANFPLTLTVTPKKQGFRVCLSYCDEHFREDTIFQMLQNYESILRTVMEDPDVSIGDISIMSDVEQQEVLV